MLRCEEYWGYREKLTSEVEVDVEEERVESQQSRLHSSKERCIDAHHVEGRISESRLDESDSALYKIVKELDSFGRTGSNEATDLSSIERDPVHPDKILQPCAPRGTFEDGT